MLFKAQQENNVLKETLDNRVHNLFSNIFTRTQINYFLNLKIKIKKWEIEDITKAISLRSISPKAYRYLRETLKYPLPGLWFLNSV